MSAIDVRLIDNGVYGNKSSVAPDPNGIPSAGILVVGDPTFKPSSGTKVGFNQALGNDPDIFWDEQGDGNKFFANDCLTSQPDGLCEDPDVQGDDNGGDHGDDGGHHGGDNHHGDKHHKKSKKHNQSAKHKHGKHKNKKHYKHHDELIQRLDSSERGGCGRPPFVAMIRPDNVEQEVEVSENETIRAQVGDDGIAVVTLARPDKRNALSIRLRSELMDTLASWADDDDVRVVILTGEGKAFSAGFDLGEFGQAELARTIRHNSTAYHRAVWSFPKPTIAAVNGPAMGGGFDLALLCDMRIASAAAVFGHPEIKFGAPPLFTPLRWIVGDGIARDLCLTGRPVDAEEALRIGLVSRVVAPDALLEEALGAARQIAEAPQRALQTTKRYLSGNQGFGFEDSFRIEHDDVFDVLLTGSAPGFG